MIFNYIKFDNFRQYKGEHTFEFSDPKNGSITLIIAENGDEFYAVTIAYHSTDFNGQIKVDQSESIDFKFFYPDELPNGIVKSHQKILNEFLSKRDSI